LNQLLARSGLCSRRKADEWILAGRVTIDGIVCSQVGVKVDPQSQRINVDGVALRKPSLLYIAMNKPKGVVTTKKDPQGRKTVMDFLPREFAGAGLFPIGRLDRETEGLLLLTNDGNWGNTLLHPSHQVWKEYVVVADRCLSPEIRRRLETGVRLDGKITLPARISKHRKQEENRYKFHIALREGRNRQVRRMCAVVGVDILSLRRISVGPIAIETLKPGEWRHISERDVKKINKMESGNRFLPTRT